MWRVSDDCQGNCQLNSDPWANDSVSLLRKPRLNPGAQTSVLTAQAGSRLCDTLKNSTDTFELLVGSAAAEATRYSPSLSVGAVSLSSTHWGKWWWSPKLDSRSAPRMPMLPALLSSRLRCPGPGGALIPQLPPPRSRSSHFSAVLPQPPSPPWPSHLFST